MSNGATMAFNVNEQTLNALRVAGRSFPIPSVATAAVVALSILEIVQTLIRREDYFAIGRDSCLIVETVIQRVQVDRNGRIPTDPAMLRHADMLVADLRYIEKRVGKVKARSRLKKIFRPQREREIIQDCRERLMHAMALFGFQYNVEIRNQLAIVHNFLNTMLGAISFPPSPRVQPQPWWQIPSPSGLSTPAEQMPGVPNLVPWGPTGSLTGPGSDSFGNTQNRRSPSVGHPLVGGDVNDTRDESFSVFGTGNTINISFAR